MEKLIIDFLSNLYTTTNNCVYLKKDLENPMSFLSMEETLYSVFNERLAARFYVSWWLRHNDITNINNRWKKYHIYQFNEINPDVLISYQIEENQIGGDDGLLVGYRAIARTIEIDE